MKNTLRLLLICMIAGTASAQTKPVSVLMVGGGSSHDFERWYRQEDVKTLESTGQFRVRYTDRTDSIAVYLKQTDVLILTNNQPIPEKDQKAITAFVEKGERACAAACSSMV